VSHDFRKGGRSVPQQLLGGRVLVHDAVPHDEDLVGIEDRVDPVRDREDRATGERLAQRLLYRLVRFVIHVGRGLVEEQNAALSQQRASQDQHLLRPGTQIFPVLRYRRIQSPRHLRYGIVQITLSERLPNLFVRVLVERIDVIANGTRKQLSSKQTNK